MQDNDLVMTLLEDLATANRNTLAAAFPNGVFSVRLESLPKPHVVISFEGEAKEGALGYPRIVTASATLFPTKKGNINERTI